MPAFPGQPAPSLTLPSINGDAFTLQDSTPDLYTVVIFYRGSHCPLCVGHMQEIEQNYQKALDTGIQIIAISMDTKEHATKFHKEVADALNQEKLQVPILYNLTEDQAREWGLYLSENRIDTNEPELFSEPGLFVIRPADNTIFMAQTQSAPFTRPSMEQLIGGLQYAAEHNYPVRGSYTTTVATSTNKKTLNENVPVVANVQVQ